MFADNNIGEDELRTNYVLANTGKGYISLLIISLFVCGCVHCKN